MGDTGESRDGAPTFPISGEDDSSFYRLLRQALVDHQDSVQGVEIGGSTRDETGNVERIGRFQVLEVIGRGGYGTVLRVYDVTLGCERAMKVPNPETLAAPRSLARFMDEARKAALIDHPNVVRVVEADEILPLSYIVMEYCRGGSLAAWLASRPVGRPIAPRWAAALVAEVADGVHEAHRRGLLHRDLKPGNVMLVPVDDGNESDPPRFHPKVGDFGLAKAIDEAPGRIDRTATGTMIGTLSYMSPEQARGDRTISEASDIYGLGAILFEVLTRSTPYSGSSEAEVLGRILDDAVAPSPRAISPGVPRDLDIICRTALAKRPGDRYRSAAELADDLRRFLRDDAVKGSPWWKRARASVRRNRARVAAGVILFTAILVGAAAWLQFRDLKRRSADEVLLNQFETAPVAKFAGLIPRIGRFDPAVVKRIDGMFVTGNDNQKLGAALVMASDRPECAEYCYQRLLAAQPNEIVPITRLLAHRMVDLPSRLTTDLQATRAPGAATDEEGDQRLAQAACALIVLGNERGWARLGMSPDPQVRSFLIHLLGPAGIGPDKMLSRFEIEPDVSIRRALIQALGEVPRSAWTSGGLARAGSLLHFQYFNDPDPGIHGSARWLLSRLDMNGSLPAEDDRLAGTPRPADRRWRIGPSRLTFVTIDDPSLDRVIEISDSEITVDQFLAFRPDHPFDRKVSPRGECPINGTSYVDAAAFCNWLSTADGVPSDRLCYKPHPNNPKLLASVEHYLNRPGYRLPEVKEASIAARAGTVSRCFYGRSEKLSPYYGWSLENSSGTTHPVARLKPNDLGLFDVLGNVAEWCEQSDWSPTPKNQALIVNSFVTFARDFDQSGPAWIRTSAKYFSLPSYGFRVARTVRTRRSTSGH